MFDKGFPFVFVGGICVACMFLCAWEGQGCTDVHLWRHIHVEVQRLKAGGLYWFNRVSLYFLDLNLELA